MTDYSDLYADKRALEKEAEAKLVVARMQANLQTKPIKDVDADLLHGWIFRAVVVLCGTVLLIEYMALVLG